MFRLIERPEVDGAPWYLMGVCIPEELPDTGSSEIARGILQNQARIAINERMIARHGRVVPLALISRG